MGLTLTGCTKDPTDAETSLSETTSDAALVSSAISATGASLSEAEAQTESNDESSSALPDPLAEDAPRAIRLETLSDPLPAPPFQLETADGQGIALADLLGQPAVVNFWATWCPPCRAEMPAMQRAWENMREQDMMMIAINVGETQAEVDAFLETMNLDFPIALDPDASASQQWPVLGLPTTFVLDAEGRLVYQAKGERDWDHPALLALLQELAR